MFWKYSTLVLLILFFTNQSFAQEETVQPSIDIPACSESDQLWVESVVQGGADMLTDFVHEYVDTEGHDILEKVDAITSRQRSYWIQVSSLPECTDLYTRAYRFGRIFDNYSIAMGLGAASHIYRLDGNDDGVTRLGHRIDDVVHAANEILVNEFTPYFEQVFGDTP